MTRTSTPKQVPTAGYPRRTSLRISAAVVMASLSLLTGIVTPGTQAAAPTKQEIATSVSNATNAGVSMASANNPHTADVVQVASSAPTRAISETRSEADTPADPLADWTAEQKVGQLFMVGVPVSGDQRASRKAVRAKHVGNIFLHGRTTAGIKPVRKIVDGYTSLVTKKRTRNTAMFVATDQEGGRVQVLRGKGFTDIPSAMTQSKWSKKKLRKNAKKWGEELSKAGVNLNLAPVTDVVTSAKSARKNGPIGVFERNYGYGKRSTWTHANAFSNGMRSSNVDVAIKHFPGLGRVKGNTDTTARVVDKVTRATKKDRQMTAFRKGINAGAPFVMMSSAVYAKIDAKNPAAFSKKTINKVLRKQLGFEGVVISDDLAAAKAVQKWKPSTRAVKFIQAGGDMVLVSADATVVAEMVDAVVAKAKKSPAFAKKVDAAVLRVLAAKERL